ncbi:MAG TPA: GAF domain-containing protein, partial [Ktedonobacteraceae bacterium]|nr:GAF domain-containing protein [Ktedonobacteraceae bacterium]
MSKEALQHIIDLTACEKEPIQTPGCIQPQGVLLVLQEPELSILQISTNSETFFGRPAQELLHQSLATLLGPAATTSLQERLRTQDIHTVNPLLIRTRGPEKELVFDGIVHRIDGGLLLELEIADPHTSPRNLYHMSLSFIEKLRNTTSLQHLCQVAVEEIQKISNFDRVMIYRFDQDWNGEVVAEQKSARLDSFLGLHFPASDIPRQARELYQQNWLRLIEDVDYQPIPIFPAENPVTHGPLNLSFSVLRSVSPVHLEYLKNMGVRASLSITLLKENRLWGLIACHHLEKRHISYDRRVMCELLGQIVSAQLSAKVDYEEHLYEIQVRTLQAQLLSALTKEENVVDGLAKHSMKILQLVNASGLALCFGDRYATVGAVPPENDIKQLVAWLQGEGDVFNSNALSTLYGAAERFKDVGSGLLAISISKVQGSYVLWFRPEVIQTVNWGGNPNAVTMTQDIRLHPRRSFELWKQTIEMTALPWKACELAAALELRSVLVDMVLRDMVLKQTLNLWLN